MTDTIADLLARIKNAIDRKMDTLDLPYSKLKDAVAKVLVAEGYLVNQDNLNRGNKKFLRLRVKYDKNKMAVIKGLKKVSKSGKRIYCDAGNLPRIQAGFGTAVISTSKGVMTDEQARAANVGGEVLLYVW